MEVAKLFEELEDSKCEIEKAARREKRKELRENFAVERQQRRKEAAMKKAKKRAERKRMERKRKKEEREKEGEKEDGTGGSSKD